MQPIIRKLSQADLADVLELWIESWTEAYPEIDFAARQDWFVDHLSDWQKNGGDVWLATAKDTVTGILCLNTTSGHLDQICIRRGRKGQGDADALMVLAQRLSPAGLHLDVNADNARAIRFYERLGFRRTGEGINPNSGRATFAFRWQP
jgi:putative acetyltransferase